MPFQELSVGEPYQAHESAVVDQGASDIIDQAITGQELEKIAEAKIPAVLIDRAPPSDALAAVNVEYRAAVRNVVLEMVAMGHRRIAVLPHHHRMWEFGEKAEGYGEGYRYAHDYEDAVTDLDCLPESLRGRRFYRPRESGQESEMARRLERFRELRRAQRKSSAT